MNHTTTQKRHLTEQEDEDLSTKKTNVVHEITFCEQYIPEKGQAFKVFSRKYGTILVKSAMGTGKTQRILEYVERRKRKNRNLRCLYITPTRSLGASFYEQSKAIGFQYYLDLKDEAKRRNRQQTQNAVRERFVRNFLTGEPTGSITDDFQLSIKNANLLVIQLESLPHLSDLNLPSFDIVLLDESESLLSHMDSPTVKRRRLVWEWLRHVSGYKAEQLIMLDADFGERSEWFAKLVRNGLIYKFVNTFKRTDRKMIFIQEDRWLHVLKEAVTSGKRVAIATNYGEKRIETLKEQLFMWKPELQLIAYHSGVSDALKRTASNCSETWTAYDVVIYSPSISVGVDFNPKRDGQPFAHMDYVFALGNPNSNKAREFMQGIGRIRHIGTNTVYVATEPDNGFFIHDRQWFREEALKRGTFLKNFAEAYGETIQFTVQFDPALRQHQWICDDEDYLELYCYNQAETEESRSKFSEKLMELAKEKGYQVETENQELEQDDGLLYESKHIEQEIKVEMFDRIVEAPIITEEELKQIQRREENGQREEEDDYRKEKRIIMTDFNLLDLPRGKMGTKLIKYHRKIKKFYNTRDMFLSTEIIFRSDIKWNNMEKDFNAHNPNRIQKREWFIILLTALGFDQYYPIERKSIPWATVQTESMKERANWVFDHWKEIESLFEVHVARIHEPAMDLFKLTQRVASSYICIGLQQKHDNQWIQFKYKQFDLFMELLASSTAQKEQTAELNVKLLLKKFEPDFVLGDVTGKQNFLEYFNEEEYCTPVDPELQVIAFWKKVKFNYQKRSVDCSEVWNDFNVIMKPVSIATKSIFGKYFKKVAGQFFTVERTNRMRTYKFL